MSFNLAKGSLYLVGLHVWENLDGLVCTVLTAFGLYSRPSEFARQQYSFFIFSPVTAEGEGLVGL